MHGIHPDDGTDEFTATTDRAGLPLVSSYLHANGYLPGRTPEGHWAQVNARRDQRAKRRARAADRLPSFRRPLREALRQGAVQAARAEELALASRPADEALEQT